MSDRSGASHPPVVDRPPESGAPEESRWLYVEREAPEADPFRFLADPAGSSGADEPWAYWRLGSRWVASRGSLAQIDSRALAGRDLCAAVRAEATMLLGPATRGRLEAASRDGAAAVPRCYGGFAFDSRWSGRSRDAATSPWAEFPPARFFLPAYELEGGDGRTRLRVWRRHEGSADSKSGRDKDVEGLERLHSRLARARGRSPGGRELASMRPVRQEVVTWPEWRDSVERVLERIRTGDVEKVVLARAVDVHLPRPPDPIGVVDAISRADPAATVFGFQFAPGTAFFGASPELLGSLRGRVFRTIAVAGSAPRGEDRAADERLGHALRQSPKERLEHAICVRELHDRLDPLTMRLDVEATPRLHRLAQVQHLRTDLSGEVEEGTHVLDLLSVLHPTAAVCGYPRDAAARELTAEERLVRGWYAGAVGWFDGAGDGDFVPGLRCAVLAGRALRLFAGAGIVEGSDAQAEWEETSLKLRTIGRALGLGEVT